jgi:hypothetical protein
MFHSGTSIGAKTSTNLRQWQSARTSRYRTSIRTCGPVPGIGARPPRPLPFEARFSRLSVAICMAAGPWSHQFKDGSASAAASS